MSLLSALPQPLKLVLKPGTYQSGDTRGGLNFNNWVKNFLKRIGFAVTSDCCLYFPSLPVLGVDFDSVDQVPNGGMFMDINNPDYIYFRNLAGDIQQLLNS